MLSYTPPKKHPQSMNVGQCWQKWTKSTAYENFWGGEGMKTLTRCRVRRMLATLCQTHQQLHHSVNKRGKHARLRVQLLSGVTHCATQDSTQYISAERGNKTVNNSYFLYKKTLCVCVKCFELSHVMDTVLSKCCVLLLDATVAENEKGWRECFTDECLQIQSV